MKSYEYKILEAKRGMFSGFDYDKLTEQLNELSRQGWEVLSTTPLDGGGYTTGLLIVLRREARMPVASS